MSRLRPNRTGHLRRRPPERAHTMRPLRQSSLARQIISGNSLGVRSAPSSSPVWSARILGKTANPKTKERSAIPREQDIQRRGRFPKSIPEREVAARWIFPPDSPPARMHTLPKSLYRLSGTYDVQNKVIYQDRYDHRGSDDVKS